MELALGLGLGLDIPIALALGAFLGYYFAMKHFKKQLKDKEEIKKLILKYSEEIIAEFKL